MFCFRIFISNYYDKKVRVSSVFYRSTHSQSQLHTVTALNLRFWNCKELLKQQSWDELLTEVLLEISQFGVVGKVIRKFPRDV